MDQEEFTLTEEEVKMLPFSELITQTGYRMISEYQLVRAC